MGLGTKEEDDLHDRVQIIFLFFMGRMKSASSEEETLHSYYFFFTG